MVYTIRYISALVLFMVISVAGYSQRSITAGEVISTEVASTLDESNLFYYEKISDEVFARIKGISYGDDCTIPRDELRYLRVLHCNKQGDILVGELICNRAIAEDLIEIFKALYRERYPIERMVLVDEYGADDNRSMAANNSSAFNFRFISGTKRLSNHSWGLAVDINPLYNPYVKSINGRTSVEPIEGEPYVDRQQSHPYIIKEGDLLYREFTSRGFTWGGSWQDRKDYQHFEKKI